MPSGFYVPFIAAIATLWLYTIALKAPSLNSYEGASLSFPSSLDELKELADLLKQYHVKHPFYILFLFVNAYLYKQMLAIPGSVFMNVLAGAIFGLKWGFCLACLLTGIGASLCYLLSKYFCKEFIIHYFPERLSSLQETILVNKDRLFYYLLFARIFPMSPNWFINISSPILNIQLPLFFITAFLGLMPYNFICVQTGVILSEISSLDDVFSYNMILKLLCVAFAALVPSFFIKNSIKK